jgi:Tfp pilus assembly protein PilV
MRLPRPARGLTLIEFLFAVSITAFLGLGVAAMFPAALRSVIVGGHMTKATLLAASFTEMIQGDKFELLISRYDNFSTTASIGGYACPVPASVPTTDARYNKMRMKCDLTWAAPQVSGGGLPGGVATVRVACVTEAGVEATGACTTDLRRLTVTVSWESNAARSFQLVTYVARREGGA